MVVTTNKVILKINDGAGIECESINAALDVIKNATDDAGVKYTIQLDGTFDEAIALDWAETNDIAFVKAEGAAKAEITGKVNVGTDRYNGSIPWSSNLTFDGITFDYSDARDNLGENPDWAAVNGERFEILCIGQGYTLNIVDCNFNGPGVIDGTFNGGQPNYNNGTEDGSSDGNLFGTPHKAVTNGNQGYLVVENTTFSNGNLNFWRNSKDDNWKFINCTFDNAPVTLMGNPGNKDYLFTDCTFKMDLSKVDGDFATYLVGMDENALGVELAKSEDGKGCTMTITGTNAEGREVSYILTQAPNTKDATENPTTAKLIVDGVVVEGEIPADVSFITAKSPADTRELDENGNEITLDQVFNSFAATDLKGVTAEDVNGAANVEITNTLEDGTVQKITTNAEGVVNESLTNTDKTLYLNGESYTADLEYKIITANSGKNTFDGNDVSAKNVYVGYSSDEAADLALVNGAHVFADTQIVLGSDSKLTVDADSMLETRGDCLQVRGEAIFDGGLSKEEKVSQELVASEKVQGKLNYLQVYPTGDMQLVNGAAVSTKAHVDVYNKLSIDNSRFETASQEGKWLSGTHTNHYGGFYIRENGVVSVSNDGLLAIGGEYRGKGYALYNEGTLEIKNGAQSVVSFNAVNAKDIKVSNGGMLKVGANFIADTTFNDFSLVNNGTIEVAGGIVEAGTVTNEGTFKVTGSEASTVKATITGNALQLENGVLENSEIAGNVNVYGTNNTINGGTYTATTINVGWNGYTTSVAKLNMVGNVELKNNGDAKPAIWVGNTEGKVLAHTLAIGDKNATTKTTNITGDVQFYVRSGAVVTVDNADFSYGYMQLKGNMTLNNSTLSSNWVNHFMYDNDGGTAKLTLNNSQWIAETEGHNEINIGNTNVNDRKAKGNAEIYLNSGSLISAHVLELMDANGNKISLTANASAIVLSNEFYLGDGATVSFTDSDLEVGTWNTDKTVFTGKVATLNGAITMDADSLITAGSIAGTGTITIDANGFSGIKKVIDITGDNQDWANVKLDFKNLGETQVAYGADGDVVLANVDTKTLYVNSAWADSDPDTAGNQPYAVGDAIPETDGKLAYGFNAFASINDAIKAAEKNGGATIDLTTSKFSGSEAGLANATPTLFQTNGTYTFTGGDYIDFAYVDTPRPTEENAGKVSVNIVFDKAKVTAGKFRLDNGSSLEIKDSYIDAQSASGASTGWTTFYGDSTITVENSVIGWFTTKQTMESDEIVAGDQKTNYLETNGLYVGRMCYCGSGVMTVTNSTVFTYPSEGDAFSLAVYDKGLMSFTNSAVYAYSLAVGGAGNKTVGRDDEVATMSFKNSTLRTTTTNGTSTERIVVGGANEAELIFDNSTVEKSAAAMTVESNGTVNMTDSKFEAAKVEVDKDGEFNVMGKNTLTIDNVSGTITAANGATLVGSKIGGAGVEVSNSRERNYVLSVNGDAAGTIYFENGKDAEGNAVANTIASLDARKGDKVVVKGTADDKALLNFSAGDGFRVGKGATWEIENAKITANYNLAVDNEYGTENVTTNFKAKNSEFDLHSISAKGSKEFQEIGNGTINMEFENSTVNFNNKNSQINLQKQDVAKINLTFKDSEITGTVNRFVNDAEKGVVTFDNTNLTAQQTFRNAGTVYIKNNAEVKATVQYDPSDSEKGSGNTGIIDINNAKLELTGDVAFENKGTITATNATIDIDKLTNNGTFTVTGDTTINIGKLTIENKKYLVFKDATLLNDSVISGGIVISEGKFTIAEKSSLKVNNINLYGNAVVEKDAVFTAPITMVGGHLTIADGGALNVKYFNVDGVADVAGLVTVTNNSSQNYSTLVRKGGVVNVSSTGSIVVNGCNGEVKDGGVLNINGGLVKVYITDPKSSGGKFKNSGTTNLNKGSIETDVAIENIGTFTATDASITAGTVTNNGSITVNGGTFTADAFVQNSSEQAIFNNVVMDVNSLNTGGNAWVVVGGKSQVKIDSLSGDNAVRFAAGTTLLDGTSIEGLGVRSLGALTVGEKATDTIYTYHYDTTKASVGTITVNGEWKIGKNNFGIATWRTGDAIKLTGSGTVNVDSQVFFEGYAATGSNYTVKGNILVDEKLTINMVNEGSVASHLRFSATDVTIKGIVANKGTWQNMTALYEADVIVTGNKAKLDLAGYLTIGNVYDIYKNTVTDAHKSSLTVSNGASVNAQNVFVNLDSKINVNNATFSVSTIDNNGIITISGNSTVNAVISGSGAVVLDWWATLAGSLTVDAMTLNGYASLADDADVSGKLTGGTLIVKGSDNTITLAYGTTTVLQVADGTVFAADDKLGGAKIQGEWWGVTFTVDDALLTGNTVANGAFMNITNVTDDFIAIDADVTQIKTINEKTVEKIGELYGFVDGTKSYVLKAKDNGFALEVLKNPSDEEVKPEDDAIATDLNSMYIDKATTALANSNIEMAAGYTNIVTGSGAWSEDTTNNMDVAFGSIQKDSDKGGINEIYVGSNVNMDINGNIESMGSASVGANSLLDVRDNINGQNNGQNVYVGYNADLKVGEDIDLKGGWNSLSVDYKGDMDITGNVKNVASLGIYSGVKDEEATIGGDFIAPLYNSNINVGYMSSLSITGDIVNGVKAGTYECLGTGTYISVGYDAAFSAKDIYGLSGMYADGKSVVTVGNIYGTMYGNGIYVAGANFTAGNIDLKGGWNSFGTGYMTTASVGSIKNVASISTGWGADTTVAGVISGVQSLNVAGNWGSMVEFSVDGAVTAADWAYFYVGSYVDADFNAGITFGTTWDTINIGSYSDVDVTGSIANVDSVYVGWGSSLKVGGDITNVQSLNVAGNWDARVSFSAANITAADWSYVGIGSFVDAEIGNITFGTTWDTMNIGYKSTVEIGTGADVDFSNLDALYADATATLKVNNGKGNDVDLSKVGGWWQGATILDEEGELEASNSGSVYANEWDVYEIGDTVTQVKLDSTTAGIKYEISEDGGVNWRAYSLTDSSKNVITDEDDNLFNNLLRVSVTTGFDDETKKASYSFELLA